MIDANLGDDEARLTGSDTPARDLKTLGCMGEGDGRNLAVRADQRDEADPGVQHVGERGHRRIVRRRHGGTVGDGQDRLVDVDLAGGGNPAAEIAVGQDAVQFAGCVQAENEAALVLRYLGESARDRSIAGDDIFRDIAFDIHKRTPDLRTASAREKSSSVSISMLSAADMGKTAILPPSRQRSARSISVLVM